MQCEDCRNQVVAGLYVRRKWTYGPFPIRCSRCGAVHSTHDGSSERIGPRVVPINDAALRRSPWRPHPTRPVLPGHYHCRFTELEPSYVVLHWDGKHFKHEGAPVFMATFMGWRGSYEF